MKYILLVACLAILVQCQADQDSIRAQYDTDHGQRNSLSNLMLDLAGCMESVLRKYNISNEVGELYQSLSSPDFQFQMEQGSDFTVKETVVKAIDPIFQKISGFDHQLVVHNLEPESIKWLRDSALMFKGYRANKAASTTINFKNADFQVETDVSQRFGTIIDSQVPTPPVHSVDALAEQKLEQTQEYIKILQHTIDLQDQQVLLLKQNLTAQFIAAEIDSIQYEKKLVEKDKTLRTCEAKMKQNQLDLQAEVSKKESELSQEKSELTTQMKRCADNFNSKQDELILMRHAHSECQSQHKQTISEKQALHSDLQKQVDENKNLTLLINQQTSNLAQLKSDCMVAIDYFNETCYQEISEHKFQLEQAKFSYDT